MNRRLFCLVNILVLFVIALVGLPVQVIAQETTGLNGVRIYFSEANLEPSRFDRSPVGISRFAGLLESLGAELLTLDWRNGIPDDADLVVIPGPGLRGNPSAAQVADLWLYMNNGGRVLILADPVIHQTRDMISSEGFFELSWLRFGLRGRDDWLVTAGEMQTVQIPEIPEEVAEGSDPEDAEEVRLITVEAPVLITDFTTTNVANNHPITHGLEGELAFFGARSLEIDVMVGAGERTPLVFSSPDYYGERTYYQYLETGYSDFQEGVDTPAGNQPLAVAYGDAMTGARLVLIGDRDVAVNGRGLSTSPDYSDAFVYPANARFLVQAVAWLLERQSPDMNLGESEATVTVELEATEEADN